MAILKIISTATIAGFWKADVEFIAPTVADWTAIDPDTEVAILQGDALLEIETEHGFDSDVPFGCWSGIKANFTFNIYAIQSSVLFGWLTAAIGTDDVTLASVTVSVPVAVTARVRVYNTDTAEEYFTVLTRTIGTSAQVDATTISIEFQDAYRTTCEALPLAKIDEIMRTTASTLNTYKGYWAYVWKVSGNIRGVAVPSSVVVVDGEPAVYYYAIPFGYAIETIDLLLARMMNRIIKQTFTGFSVHFSAWLGRDFDYSDGVVSLIGAYTNDYSVDYLPDDEMPGTQGCIIVGSATVNTDAPDAADWRGGCFANIGEQYNSWWSFLLDHTQCEMQNYFWNWQEIYNAFEDVTYYSPVIAYTLPAEIELVTEARTATVTAFNNDEGYSGIESSFAFGEFDDFDHAQTPQRGLSDKRFTVPILCETAPVNVDNEAIGSNTHTQSGWLNLNGVDGQGRTVNYGQRMFGIYYVDQPNVSGDLTTNDQLIRAHTWRKVLPTDVAPTSPTAGFFLPNAVRIGLAASTTLATTIETVAWSRVVRILEAYSAALQKDLRQIDVEMPSQDAPKILLFQPQNIDFPLSPNWGTSGAIFNTNDWSAVRVSTKFSELKTSVTLLQR